MHYFWVRIYDYRKNAIKTDEIDFSAVDNNKGTLLDEYYLSGETLTRNKAKEEVKNRSKVTLFAKPRKKDGIYAIVLESEEFFYNRFMIEIDTICFNCHKKIKGKLKNFPNMMYEDKRYCFCSYDCYHETQDKINPYHEGEFQEREGYEQNGRVYGYVYHVYNRKTNMHYIGQTVYMPFFRWQEHAKDGLKGDLCDLVFETITEVKIKSQEYLNNVEAWWIRKYIHDYGRDNVMNISIPKITIEDLIEEYDTIIEKHGKQLNLDDYIEE